ncbi:MAG: MFS transporter [Clostridiales bacterium]|nr:MFS transporter [Clostridiales bacterium]
MAIQAKRVKYACYSVNVCMAVVGNLSPVLFLTFHNLYKVSYSLLGLLVLINFSTQLIIDLIFSFFSHKFNIPKTVKTIPVLTIIGLCVYALWPYVFSQSVYVGLVIGTIIFSASSGLAEVLISPVIAALPSDNPDAEMSKLHSIYAWGVVFVVAVCTLFLLFIGNEHWQWLALSFVLVPLLSGILFFGTELPKMQTPEKTSGALAFLKDKGLWLCVAAIFLGGASECTMAQWCSGYLEQALGIPKIWGDIFGVALFAVALGLGRSLYAKYGKNIAKVLCLGAVGATVCYLTAAVLNVPVVGLLACALTGFCVSMLWPGSLIVASDRFPTGGVFIFAMMAAGGDLGASVGPQLVGVVADFAATNSALIAFAESMSLTPDQLGLKLGMLVGMLFPLIAIFVYLKIWKGKKSTVLEESNN